MVLALMIIAGLAVTGAMYACCVVASKADESYYKYKYGENDEE